LGISVKYDQDVAGTVAPYVTYVQDHVVSSDLPAKAALVLGHSLWPSAPGRFRLHFGLNAGGAKWVLNPVAQQVR